MQHGISAIEAARIEKMAEVERLQAERSNAVRIEQFATERIHKLFAEIDGLEDVLNTIAAVATKKAA